MKKIIVIALILTALSTYTIVHGDRIEDQIRITVTADRKTDFDMFHSGKGIVKGLTTPYEFTFNRTDSRFIFKSRKGRANLQIKVEENGKTTLTAEWPITVVSIRGHSYETFGME